MLDIDFLPAQYHRRQARKRSQPWQVIVVLSFVALVAAAAVGQYRRHGVLRAKLQTIEPQYEQAVAMREQVAARQKTLQQSRAEAALLTYLRHPWPRTQLLRAIVDPLPDAIVLNRLEISNERRAAQGRPERPRSREKDDDKSRAMLTPAERDLAALRQQVDSVETMIRISGTTGDGAALHRYVGQLARGSLFRRAELESIESFEGGNGHTVRFQASVAVRPGYGQPGGPTGREHETIARYQPE